MGLGKREIGERDSHDYDLGLDECIYGLAIAAFLVALTGYQYCSRPVSLAHKRREGDVPKDVNQPTHTHTHKLISWINHSSLYTPILVFYRPFSDYVSKTALHPIITIDVQHIEQWQRTSFDERRRWSSVPRPRKYTSYYTTSGQKSQGVKTASATGIWDRTERR